MLTWNNMGKLFQKKKRVQDLLGNIKDNSPASNAAKGTILATPTLRNSFANAVAHLATTLQLGQLMQDNHNISATQTGRGRNGRG
jgi:7,8-dihydro-6-hydroxymethylpterin-pyrophosphokinase